MKKILSFLNSFKSVIGITFALSIIFLRYFNTISEKLNLSVNEYKIISYVVILISIIVGAFLIRDIYNLLKKIGNR